MKFIGRALIILALLAAMCGLIYSIVSASQWTARTFRMNSKDYGHHDEISSKKKANRSSHKQYFEDKAQSHDLSFHKQDSKNRNSLAKGIAGILGTLAVIALITFSVNQIGSLRKLIKNLRS